MLYPNQTNKVRFHQVDIAMVPINGRDDVRHRLAFEGNFTCEEAVEFALQVGTVGQLASGMLVNQAVGILEDDGRRVVAVAVGINPADPRGPHGRHRPLANDPKGNVDRMDIEGDDETATQGYVEVPDQVLQAALDGRRLRRIEKPATDADRGNHGQLAQFPLAHSFGDLDVHRVGGYLIVNQKGFPFLRCSLAGGLDAKAAGHVHRNGFRHVDVQPGFDGGAGLPVDSRACSALASCGSRNYWIAGSSRRGLATGGRTWQPAAAR